MNRKPLWIALLLIWCLAGFATPVRADGIIVPPICPKPGCPPRPCLDCPPGPPRPIAQLVIRYHHVTVTIQDQIAVTHVDQVFFNPNSWPVEGTYIFPLPSDAVVSSFTLWVDGQPVNGEVLSADQARQYYEDTIRQLRDPALLEYEGRGAVKASVFPIPPQGERRIELEYSQALTAQNGLVRYVYPLNTEKFSAQPLEDVSIHVEIRDRQAIRAVYSPSHPVDLNRTDDHHVIAGYEAKNIRPESDFTLYYSLGESQAFHLFTYRDPADATDPDGFFLLLLAPKPGENTTPVAKDVLLVLDRSGSMEGEKFQQAQSALRFILKKLNPQDRFYLQTFSTGLQTYADGLRSASEVPEALQWVDQLSAAGSTDINRALLEAASVVDRERPTYLIFLTDGLPTEGVVEIPQILNNVAQVMPANVRLFPFGVGYDVNTLLLDSLSQAHHGQSTYVRPGESLDESLSAFYERISMPVLTDLKLDFGALATYDLYPSPLPDLFAGNQVVVVGRYRDGGPVDVTLQGSVNGETQTFRYPEQLFTRTRTDSAVLDMIPRLWATRKIGYLLNQVRLKGPDKETIQQIIKLSVRYGIVTEYTSYLVNEPVPLGADAQNKTAQDAYGQASAAPMESTGKGAVDRAAQQGQMQSANSVPQPQSPQVDRAGQTQSSEIRAVGSRTFILQNGVWMDTTFDPQMMKPQEVTFLSADYFRLLAARPDLAAVFALGDQVTVVVDQQAYQVVSEGQATRPLTLPPAVPSATVPPVSATIIQGRQPTSTPAPTQPAKLVSATAYPAPAQPPAQTARPASCFGGMIPLGVILAAALIFRGHKYPFGE